MKSFGIRLLSALGLAGLLVGCSTPSGRPNYTVNGALMGAGSGAAIGALADHHNPGFGAAIGAAAGLIAGGLMGHSMDQQAEARERYYPPPPPPPPPPPTVADIKSMTRSGVGDDVIIGQIRNTRAVYHLDANALIDLKNTGVSQRVMACMLDTANLATAAGAMPPTAPGPGYVWVDGEWSWRGGAWVWVSGRWLVPPYPGAVWVAVSWQRGPRGWYRVGGYWR